MNEVNYSTKSVSIRRPDLDKSHSVYEYKIKPNTNHTNDVIAGIVATRYRSSETQSDLHGFASKR